MPASHTPDAARNPDAAGNAVKRPKFVALSWIAFACGFVGTVTSWLSSVNIVTAIAAGAGFILGVIAVFGSQKVIAATGIVLCVAGIGFTVKARSDAVAGQPHVTEQLDRAADALERRIHREAERRAPSPGPERTGGDSPAPAPSFGG